MFLSQPPLCVNTGMLISCPTHAMLQRHGGLQRKLTDRILKNVLNYSHAFSYTKRETPGELTFIVNVVLKIFPQLSCN